MDTNHIVEMLRQIADTCDCLAGVMLLSDGTGHIEVDGEIVEMFDSDADLLPMLIRAVAEYRRTFEE